MQSYATRILAGDTSALVHMTDTRDLSERRTYRGEETQRNIYAGSTRWCWASRGRESKQLPWLW